MPYLRVPNAPTVCLRLLLASVFLLTAVAGRAALRLEADGVPPFLLEVATIEDNTAWYDAEGWLGHFPGTVTWEPESGRLSYREGDQWAALRAEPPYVLRNGLPVAGAEPVRRDGNRLLVSEGFLRRTGPALLGRPLRVAAAADRERRRVVVDAGHGGSDVGSRGGPGGGAEKDLALDLALDVAEALRGAGYAAHLTRSGDHPIGAEKRAAVANYWGAELFVSFHASGEGRPQARGFEVFVAPQPAAGLDPQRWDAGQVGHAEASRRWADVLLAQLGQTLATFDRGVGVLPSPLLEAVACPAALVEVGTLAWPGDAETLNSAAGRRRIAAAVVGAAETYFTAPTR